MSKAQKITPYLWFDSQAEAAAELYTSVFPNSKIIHTQEQGDAVQMIQLSLSGQAFTAFNGGPMFSFNPSISFYVVCESETEIDLAWEKLIDGGKALMPLNKYDWSEKYGWLEDRYGISWQLTLGKIEEVGQKISPVFMFTGDQHGNAEKAIKTYTEIFDNSGINLIARYEEGEGDPALGTIKHAQFRIADFIGMAMDSSHMHGFSFNESISFVVSCQTQEEVDYFWEKLTADGGEEMMCAWLKDKYGIVWQIVPVQLMALLSDPDPERAQRAIGAMMQMRKIDIAELQRAANGEGPTVVTVQTTVQAPIEKVWEMWTKPEHITNWNFAIDAWHSPKAENDLKVGGQFNYRMEAKDGSMGFDYTGTYTAINAHKSIAFTLDDNRKVQVHFSVVDEGTFVMETFAVEDSNDVEMQKNGWQSILNNFKKYVESN
jgi:predicted 3-demethylubiquinone-9 3-methyltransferase (glyoxalase superfamily)/uncharacterized protein YndB with AHSA1/START domain